MRAARQIERKVAARQNRTNFPFHAEAKSCPAISANNSKGSAILKTNEFSCFAKSLLTSFRRDSTYPRTISRKIGSVALMLKIRFSIRILTPPPSHGGTYLSRSFLSGSFRDLLCKLLKLQPAVLLC